MTKTKKTRIIGIFLIVILIVLGSTGAYLVKVNKEKSLNIQIEEVNKSFSSLKISNINSDEEEFYNKLKDSFNNSIGDKNLSEANNVLNKINDLKSSVEKRVKEEEKNVEEEKIRKENERELALKDVAEKEEDEVKENTINK